MTFLFINPRYSPLICIPTQVSTQSRFLISLSLVWFFSLTADQPLWIIQCQSHVYVIWTLFHDWSVPIFSLHFFSLVFLSCHFSYSDVSFRLLPLFLFVDKEWQCNYVYILLYYSLMIFTHYFPSGLNRKLESKMKCSVTQVGCFSPESRAVLVIWLKLSNQSHGLLFTLSLTAVHQIHWLLYLFTSLMVQDLIWMLYDMSKIDLTDVIEE